jgi:NADH-quinone oxidoreductase subunit K
MRGLDPRTRITACLSAADSRTSPRVKPADDARHHEGPPPMMDVGLGHYLVVSAILLVLGIFGIFLNRKNVIVILMSIELILLAVNLNFVAFSAALNDLAGQVMAMFVLTVAAAEAAIGLAIVVIYFRNRGSIQVEGVNLMKG